MSVGFTDFGFLTCGLAFAVLAAMLRPGKVAAGMPRLHLRIAAIGTVLWVLLAGVAHRRGLLDPALAHLLSLALAGIWIWQLDPLARLQNQPRLLRVALRGSGALAVFISVVWMLASAQSNVVPTPTVKALAVLGLFLCAFGLVAFEQLYRNAPPGAQRALRWLGLGFGGIQLAGMLAFADTLLLGNIPVSSWPVTLLVYTLCAVAMIRGARLMPQWTTGLSVSRHVVFYAGSFVLVGSYLVLMGVAGWLMLTFGNGWQPGARASFAVLAALGLALSLFSGGLLGRLRVLISRHFYPQRYDYRAEWQRFTRTLSEDEPGMSVPQRAIRAVAQMVDSPYGRLWRRESGNGRFECSAHWPSQIAIGGLVAAHAELPAYLSRTGWLVDLRELAETPELYGGLTVDAVSLGIGTDALIVPLLHVDQLYGWIVLERSPDLSELDFEDRDLLKIAGRHVAAHLAQFDTDARLSQASQFETYNRMTAFVMHDLKNIAAQLRLISQNAERHRRNPEFVEDAFRTISAAATRMTKLISQLASGGEGGTLQTLDLASCAERAAVRCSTGAPVPLVDIRQRPAVFADMEYLTTVIEHALRNAQDATPATGEVRIEVDQRDARPLLTVADTGSGMDAQFVRDRLFRPFDTTKGSRGMGIGAYQIREYLRMLGGEVEVQSEPGRGTRMTMLFSNQSIASMDRRAG